MAEERAERLPAVLRAPEQEALGRDELLHALVVRVVHRGDADIPIGALDPPQADRVVDQAQPQA